MALSAPRPQTDRLGENAIPPLWKLPVKGSTKIYAGSLVVIDAGYAKPGTAATGLLAAGRAESTVDNTSGADGAKVVVVRRGAFKWKNSSSGEAIAQADVGKYCYVADDETVSKTSDSGARSPCGLILQIETDGVLVETGVEGQVALKILDT